MPTDIIDLRDFYQSPTGFMVKRVLRAKINDMWPTLTGERVLILGFGLSLLWPLSKQALALYEFMPASQGVCYWPPEGPNISCLVDLPHLPLPDNCVDRVIVLHTIESLAEPSFLLREVGRVLKSGGRFLAIVPNRRGLWAHSDRTPFGNGRPYSSSQIKKELQKEEFCIERVCYALYTPPSSLRINLSLADKIEKTAAWLFPGFGGVVLIEASKQLYAPIPAAVRVTPRLILPLPLPDVTPQPT